MVNILHHSFIHCTGTNQCALVTLIRISTSFLEESEERSSFLRQIISCSLTGQLIIAVLNFQRFFDRSFVSAFELIVILKLD